jgi:tetratricopeptide (TPR) repeat protein
MSYKALVCALLVATTGGVTAGFADNIQAPPQGATEQRSDQDRRTVAHALFQAERFQDAARQWKMLTDAGSNQAYDYYWLGESYFHLGQYVDAAEAFRQAAKLDPKMDNANIRLAESYLANNNFKEALESCSEGLAASTNAYARKQLETLGRVASKKRPAIPPIKATGAGEAPNGPNNK